VAPVYPDLARQAGVQGAVRLNIVIDKQGHVSNISVISGHPLLIPAALDAVKQWEYKPTLLNGQPVEVATEVSVPFVL
jgi:protein TonB